MRERGVPQLGPYHPDEGDRVEANQRRHEEVPDEHHFDRHAEHSQRHKGGVAEIDDLLGGKCIWSIIWIYSIIPKYRITNPLILLM